MRRFGFSVLICFVVLIPSLSLGECDRVYDEEDMGKLTTLTRIVMDIVFSEFVDKPAPKKIEQPQILGIVRTGNVDFEQLKMFEKYHIVMVSDGKSNFAAVVWDARNDRKLLQDLRCTLYPDDKAWERVEYGHDFTLSWNLCPK